MTEGATKARTVASLLSDLSTLLILVLVIVGALWAFSGKPLTIAPKVAVGAFFLFAMFAWVPIYTWIVGRLGLVGRGGSGATVFVGLLVTSMIWIPLIGKFGLGVFKELWP